MEVGTEVLQLRKSRRKRRGRNLRLEGADAKPLYALDAVKKGQKLQKICRAVAEIFPLLRILKIPPVGREVDAGQHKFPHTVCGETLCLPSHLPRATGAYVAAEKGDNAIGAVLVAAVLHL